MITRRRGHAFTLIELLVVMAIISILATIAMPNFLEAQTRAKVTRMKADMRSMATALESYMVDQNHYPMRRDQYTNPSPPGILPAPPFKEKVCDVSHPTASVGLHVITTPIAYFNSLPRDIFNEPARAKCTDDNLLLDCIDYWDSTQVDAWLGWRNGLSVPGKAKGWMLVSVGPDKYFGLTSMGMPGSYPYDLMTAMSGWDMYDPTNGTISLGNIFRFQGDLTQRDILWKQ